MADGQGCKCSATGANECGCAGVDWTPQKLIDARAELTRLRAELAEAQRHAKVLAKAAEMQDEDWYEWERDNSQAYVSAKDYVKGLKP